VIGRAWSDGGNRMDIAACAVYLLVNEDGEMEPRKVENSRELPGGTTNMEAEYQGVILAMETALREGVENQTVDRHLRGVYKVRDERMRAFWQKCMELGERFDHVEITWVPREQNKMADAICRRVMNRKKPAKRARPSGAVVRPPQRPNPFVH
jgi:ribonuclease HI